MHVDQALVGISWHNTVTLLGVSLTNWYCCHDFYEFFVRFPYPLNLWLRYVKMYLELVSAASCFLSSHALNRSKANLFTLQVR